MPSRSEDRSSVDFRDDVASAGFRRGFRLSVMALSLLFRSMFSRS